MRRGSAPNQLAASVQGTGRGGDHQCRATITILRRNLVDIHPRLQDPRDGFSSIPVGSLVDHRDFNNEWWIPAAGSSLASTPGAKILASMEHLINARQARDRRHHSIQPNPLWRRVRRSRCGLGDSPVFGLLLPSSVRALGLDQLLRDPLQPATFGELLHQRLELTYQLAPILARLHPHTCYEL